MLTPRFESFSDFESLVRPALLLCHLRPLSWINWNHSNLTIFDLERTRRKEVCSLIRDNRLCQKQITPEEYILEPIDKQGCLKYDRANPLRIVVTWVTLTT